MLPAQVLALAGCASDGIQNIAQAVWQSVFACHAPEIDVEKGREFEVDVINQRRRSV
jgi:hypothetical protein